MLKTTVGQVLVNSVLPPDLRDYSRTMDKKNIQKVLQEVAEKYPDKYKTIVFDLSKVGYNVATADGGFSVNLNDLRRSVAGRASAMKIEKKVDEIYADDKLTQKQKEKKVVDLLISENDSLSELVFKESFAEKNPLALQIFSGAKGNKNNLKSLRAGDLLYVDHRERPIPIPILRSYSQGLSPAEYFAGSFGARKGVIDVKFATQDAGFFSKQLNQIAHRLLVTARDRDKEPDQPIGMPVSVEDPDNEGALLALPAGGYPKNTILTPKIISSLQSSGIDKILVRSPIVSGPVDGGLYGMDVGVRERGSIPPIGDFVGIAAGQALSEPLTQAQISSKHSGGVIGAARGVSGFKLVNQLVQVPNTFKAGASHAQVDGTVQSIREAPQGGQYILIDGKEHYVGSGYDVLVKKGDKVEAGDVLSNGIPNPFEIVKHKGIGEGRKYFVNSFLSAYKDSGMPVHRRNVEILARGLIDHVRMKDEFGDYLPDDIVTYSGLEHSYNPRDGSTLSGVDRSLGMYLEKPVLHFSVGTKIRPSVQKTLKDFGINNVMVHKDEPVFEPHMVRGLETITQDPDWMTRFLGSYLQKNLLKGVYRTDSSDISGTSYVPALSMATPFAEQGKTKGYQADKKDIPLVNPTILPDNHPKKTRSVLEGLI